MKKMILIIFLLLLTACSQTIENKNNDENITSFEDCLNAGHPIMESYPRACRDSLNRTFVEEMEIKYCAKDLKKCSDETYVMRNSNNNCEFFTCP